MNKSERRIDVIEFRNGKATHLYYGIEATAYAFHCSPELIKGLIYTGQPFPYENDIVTFDLAPNCKYHIEPKNTSDRKYAYKVCEDENKIKKEEMKI